MSKTRHFQARMSQRAINEDMVDIALQFGTRQGDQVVLTQKGGESLLAELQRLERKIKKVIDKGGLVVIEERGELITTYSARKNRKQAS